MILDLPPRLACFHAQQAAEKALKATLVTAGTPVPRTHDLVALVALVTGTARSLLEPVDLALLDPWAVDGRYPGDIPDVTIGEAHLVIDTAEQIVTIVRSALR